MTLLEDIEICDRVIENRRKELKEMEDHRAGLLADALKRGITKEDLPHGLYLLMPEKRIRYVVNTGRLAIEDPDWERHAHIPGPEVIRLLGRDRVRDLVKDLVTADDYLEALRVNVTDLKKALKKRAMSYLDKEEEITGYHVHYDPRPIRVGGRS
ncbi:hypothetical protein FTO68_06210 [Methanocalculus taiwanensis]|uniref:Uncharacterized protein n=1 Tax=Methanocalculus taiwanensis TaxID=106207 RepID=A0ABD4TLD1_9EURY|nr:hypothetical protein [Methanocalculus taiwanensis]MCQ1538578.1 hypothetical protein [Methanocalculus taiwanensis]